MEFLQRTNGSRDRGTRNQGFQSASLELKRLDAVFKRANIAGRAQATGAIWQPYASAGPTDQAGGGSKVATRAPACSLALTLSPSLALAPAKATPSAITTAVPSPPRSVTTAVPFPNLSHP